MEEYFLVDNVAGLKCREWWLKRNNHQLYVEIIEWCKENGFVEYVFKQQVYHFINKKTDIPLCLSCFHEVKYRDLKRGYSEYCSTKCSDNSRQKYEKWLCAIKPIVQQTLAKRRNTIIEKYNSLEEYNNLMFEKRKQASFEKDGEEFLFRTKSFKTKRKITLKEKYGIENWNNVDKIKKTKIEKGIQLSEIDAVLFSEYKKLAKNKTKLVYKKFNKLINIENLTLGIKLYHIDHRFSLKQAYICNIPIDIITHPYNLKILWHSENIKKQDKCEITLEALTEGILNYPHDTKDMYRDIANQVQLLLKSAKK